MVKLGIVGRALVAAMSIGTSLAAQTVSDGGFEQGLGIWSVVNTPTGAGAPGTAQPYDIDGSGPLAASPALQLHAGKVLGATSGGVDLVQSIALVGGQEYAARFHWSLENTGRGSYTSTTKFRLLVSGVSAEITPFFTVGPGQTLRGTVEDTFVAPSTGTFDLTIRVESLGVADARLTQYIDNIVLGPAADVYCSVAVTSNGCPPVLSFGGSASLASPAPFDIQAAVLLNNKPGLLFYGLSGPAQTYISAWDGTLCVQPPLRRTPVQFTGGNAPPDDCSGTLTFDFNDWIRSGADPLLTAGQSVHCQYWFRDPNKLLGIGVSLTNGLSFEVGP